MRDVDFSESKLYSFSQVSDSLPIKFICDHAEHAMLDK